MIFKTRKLVARMLLNVTICSELNPEVQAFFFSTVADFKSPYALGGGQF